MIFSQKLTNHASFLEQIILDESTSCLERIKCSHVANELSYERGQIDSLQRLDEYLVESAEAKLSSRVSDVSDTYFSHKLSNPTRFPIIANNIVTHHTHKYPYQ